MDYYKFELERTLGLICSNSCNSVYDSKGKYAFTGALENVYVWNLRTGELAQKWSEYGNRAEVTRISGSKANADLYAVGYSDGTVRIWSFKAGAVVHTFSGHKTSITAMVFDMATTKLASASREGEVVIWDLISEAGLFRLKGHSNAITGLAFSSNGNALITASKDSLLKAWDLVTQHCVEMNVIHHSEITAIAVDSTCKRVITTGSDKILRLFAFDEEAVALAVRQVDRTIVNEQEGQVFKLLETINRNSNERSVSLELDSTDKFLACLSADRSLEMWRVKDGDISAADARPTEAKKAKSLFKQTRYSRLAGKATSVAFSPVWKIKSKNAAKLLLSFHDNQVSEILLPLDASQDLSTESNVDALGHRGEAKVIAFSPDSSLLATASKGILKVWNPLSGAMLRTSELERGVTFAIFLDNSSLIAGDESGTIHMIDLTSGDIIDSCQAHDGAIRCATLRPDNKGMATGGADKNIKFWEFKAAKNTVGKKLKMIKSLQMKDEISFVRYSPDLRYFAAATLDLTVKVFFEDTLRFYLSLYGHKLPVTSFDISSDSKILISASADKNVKVWSLEFGDCRKSIFAHQDAIMGISFVPGTKLFITCSKDKSLKFWDGEKFQELQKLTGHIGDVWAFAMSKDGRLLASASKDRSIKVWRSGEEMLFPEEEKENELEEQFEKSMLEENAAEREENSEEVGKATTNTVMSMKNGERIMEAIEAADDFRRKMDEYSFALSKGLAGEKPTPEGLYLVLGRDKSPADLVLSVISRIPLPDLEEALLCLPTSAISSLFLYAREWLATKRNVVITSRIVDILLRLFHRYIMANAPLQSDLIAIRDLERSTLQQFKDVLGFNNIAAKMSL